MFDYIKDFSVECPECGNIVEGFQTKEGPGTLSFLPTESVNSFYSSCDNCNEWIEYHRVQPKYDYYDSRGPFKLL